MSEHDFPAGYSERPLERRPAVIGILMFLFFSGNISKEFLSRSRNRCLCRPAWSAGKVLVSGVFLVLAFFTGAGTAGAQTPAAPTFGSTSVEYNFKVGEAKTETLPAANDGNVCNTYTISSQPGDGLHFTPPGTICAFGSDGVTPVNFATGGTISGTPTVAKARTKYVLTVTDGTLPTGRRAMLDVWITVEAQDPVTPPPDPNPDPPPDPDPDPPPSPQEPPPTQEPPAEPPTTTEEPPPAADLMPEFDPSTFSAQNYEQDVRIAPVTLPAARGGDAPLRYSLSPALPEGLGFNEATRVISGTPAETVSETTYTLTATDSDGDAATLTFTIEVEPGVVEPDAMTDRKRLKEINLAVLPEVARTMTSSALGAVTGRIEDATAGRATGGLASRSPVSGFSGIPVEDTLEDPHRFSRADLGDLSFAVSLAGSDDDFAGDGKDADEPGRIAVWAVGDYGRLSGKRSTVDWKGGLFAGHLGTDVRLGRDFIMGVAASWFEGSFDYTFGGGAGETATGGEIESRMTGFHPYMSWSLTEAFSMWAAAGWGFGEIRINDKNIQGRQKSDSIMRTGAAGGKLRLFSGSGSISGGGVPTVDLKGEAWLTRLNIEGNGDRIEGVTTDVNRLRLALKGAYELALKSGASLTPSLEFGARRDGGDGETGFGAELGGGLSYFAPALGLTVEMNGRGLLAHEGKAKDWGIAGAVRYDRGADRRGLSFSMLPSYGETAGGVSQMWERGVTGRNADGGDPSFGLDTEVGYGFAALGGRGLMTPYGGVGPAYGDGRNYRLGSRLEIGRRFDLKLEGERLERETGESGHGLILSGRMNW